MKVIDLLNKIANGEEVPEKIGYAGQYWINRYPNDYEGLGYGGCLLNNVCLNNLNDEVEILEEPKGIPEKLLEFIHTDSLNYNTCNIMFETLTNKINEIIDCLEYLESKGDK